MTPVIFDYVNIGNFHPMTALAWIRSVDKTSIQNLALTINQSQMMPLKNHKTGISVYFSFVLFRM